MDYIKFQKDIYQLWKNFKFFESKKNPDKPFCITLPPPNVTGKLHLGHAWDAIIQDIVIRFKKLQGFDTFFLCGTDHAGIATQSKVEQEYLKDKKIARIDVPVKKYKTFANKWIEETRQNIHKQWSEFGLLIDWNEEVFTLDAHFSEVVKDVFAKLYHDNLIVQEGKMIHWDCLLQSAISDIEVYYEDVESYLYYVKYFLANNKENEFILIATSRIETIFCDVALIVHPEDPRYAKYHGSSVINPLNNEVIPILLSKNIELSFGTGAMKLTPGHDFHDYEINKNFNLKINSCINKDGSLNKNAGKFENIERFASRELIANELKLTDNLEKIEAYKTRIAKSQRTNTIIEPFYSVQWFVKTQKLAKEVLKIQKSKNKVKFHPERFEKTFNNWLENIEDWCISRQLWWGHPIPIAHNLLTNEQKIVFDNKIQKNWKSDPDVLDTWFSSALWPFVSLKWPAVEGKWKSYFPTNLLVTGYDIIFFWVARMMMMSLYVTKLLPFKDVYIHGLIRDENNRKMSKSLNNGVDPSDVIKKYGADSLRHYLISNSEAGLDLRYDAIKLETLSFALINKINTIYNDLKKMSKNFENFNTSCSLNDFVQKNSKWDILDIALINALNNFQKGIVLNIQNYTFTNIQFYIREYFYNILQKHYLTLLKNNFCKHPDYKIKTQLLIYVFLEFLKYLHPIIPYITDSLHYKITKQLILENPWIEIQCFKKYENKLIWYPGFITLVNILKNKFEELKNKKIFLNTNLDKIAISISLTNIYNLEFISTHSEADYEIEFIGPESSKLQNVNNSNIQHLFVININNLKIKLNDSALKLQIENILFEINRCENMLKNSKFLEKAPKNLISQEKAKLVIHYQNLERIKKEVKNNDADSDKK